MSGRTRGGGLLLAFVFMGDHPALPDLPLLDFFRLDRRRSSPAFPVLEACVALLCLQHQGGLAKILVEHNPSRDPCKERGGTINDHIWEKGIEKHKHHDVKPKCHKMHMKQHAYLALQAAASSLETSEDAALANLGVLHSDCEAPPSRERHLQSQCMSSRKHAPACC